RGPRRPRRACNRGGAMARKRLVLKNTALFSDPANLSWERYVVMQARERERYLTERATIADDALNYRTVSPRYLENAVDQFANNYYSELSATHYVATAAANAPFDEPKKSALFQLADEQRHLEMDREVFERAAIPERDWLAAGGARPGGKVSSPRTTRSRSRWGFARPPSDLVEGGATSIAPPFVFPRSALRITRSRPWPGIAQH